MGSNGTVMHAAGSAPPSGSNGFAKLIGSESRAIPMSASRVTVHGNYTSFINRPLLYQFHRPRERALDAAHGSSLSVLSRNN